MTANTSSAVNRWRLELRMEWLKLLRTPAFSWPTLLFPVVFYALFALGMQPMGSARSAVYLLSTYVIFSSIGPGLFGMGMLLATERAHGWHDLQRAAPVPVPFVLAAKLVTCTGFALGSMLLIMLVAYFAGGVELPVHVWGLLAIVSLVAALPFGLVGASIGLLMRPTGAMAVINALFLPSAVLSGLWFPLSMLAPVLQSIGSVLPFYHLGQLALMASGQVVADTLWMHVGASLAWLVAFTLLTVWVYRKSRR